MDDADRDARAMARLREIYAAERNVELSNFWDAGWVARFGDSVNGYEGTLSEADDPADAILGLEWSP